MDQTTQLKIEFFELVRALNQSNLNINQKTEVSFFIETTKSKSILYATTNKKFKMQLIFKNRGSSWQPSGFTGLLNLEAELAQLFQSNNLELIQSHDLTKKN